VVDLTNILKKENQYSVVKEQRQGQMALRCSPLIEYRFTFQVPTFLPERNRYCLHLNSRL
jgi:hypothetical protein